MNDCFPIPKKITLDNQSCNHEIRECSAVKKDGGLSKSNGIKKWEAGF
jgi:hypothetical protein